MREPFAGVTPALYAELSDYQIAEIYLAPRDKEHTLIPLAQRRRPEGTGRPSEAAHELPKPQDLGIPQEVLNSGPPVAFVTMFYAINQERGLSAAETTRKWWEYLKKEHEGTPHGGSPGHGKGQRSAG